MSSTCQSWGEVELLFIFILLQVNLVCLLQSPLQGERADGFVLQLLAIIFCLEHTGISSLSTLCVVFQ